VQPGQIAKTLIDTQQWRDQHSDLPGGNRTGSAENAKWHLIENHPAAGTREPAPLRALDGVTLTVSSPDESGLMLATDDFSLAAGVGTTEPSAALDDFRDLADRHAYLVENQHRIDGPLVRELAAIRLRLVGEKPAPDTV